MSFLILLLLLQRTDPVSFCSASEVADTTSTVGAEKRQNPALVAPSLEAFGATQVLGYKQFPRYYRHMAPSNLEPMGAPPEAPLPTVSSPDDVVGATIIDVRPFPEFAAGHIPGSLSFEMSNDDAVYMGWTLEWGLTGSACRFCPGHRGGAPSPSEDRLGCGNGSD